MEISHRQLPRVDVLSISGRLQAAEAQQLQEKINELFAQKRYRILLDLEQLEYVSSGGLRVFINARKAAQEQKAPDGARGDVRIVNMSPQAEKTFQLVGFQTCSTFMMIWSRPWPAFRLKPLYVAIDAGQSHTECIAVDAGGSVFATGRAGPSYIQDGSPLVVSAFDDALACLPVEAHAAVRAVLVGATGYENSRPEGGDREELAVALSGCCASCCR